MFIQLHMIKHINRQLVVLHTCTETFFHTRHSTEIHKKSLDAPITGSHITLQPKTGFLLKLSRVEPGQYLDGRPEKTRSLLGEVLVRPAGGAHPVVCVGPNVTGTLYCKKAPSFR